MINVVKVGGGILENEQLLAAFLNSFHLLPGKKILVHGGGRLATEIALSLGIETQMIEGRRVTDEKMLEVVTMVYGGLANKKVVAGLQALGTNALGLSGADGNIIKSHKRKHATIDYGFVGDIDEVDGSFLIKLLDQGITPVIAPLTHDKAGQLLNTNADTIAGEVAKAVAKLSETQLILGFELDGVLSDPKNDQSVINLITTKSFEDYKKSGVISGGMIPKLTNAFSAINNGVKSVKICNAIKVGEAANNQSFGTLIIA